MARGLEQRGSNGSWSWRFRPFGGKQIRVTIHAESPIRAKHIQKEIKEAIEINDYSFLSNWAKPVAKRMFDQLGLAVPKELDCSPNMKGDLTLMEATDVFLNYPTVRGQTPTKDPVTGKKVPNHPRERHTRTMCHALNYFEPEKKVKDIWVPEIREYCAERLEKVTEATVNRELSTLSKFFRVMIENKRQTGIESNPVSFVERFSEKLGERVVYISAQDFRIFEECCDKACPGGAGITRYGVPWLKALAQIQYYTGLRQEEALKLMLWQVDLEHRVLYFGPQDVKERNRKKVPIHKELLPVLEKLLQQSPTNRMDQRLILIQDLDGKGTRPPAQSSLKNPWRSIVDIIGLKPRPRLTDLRHTWRRNARRSNVSHYIAESILGHWTAEATVQRRYGKWIETSELIEEIDKMTFDHGETHIFVPRECDQFVTNGSPNKEKGHAAT